MTENTDQINKEVENIESKINADFQSEYSKWVNCRYPGYFNGLGIIGTIVIVLVVLGVIKSVVDSDVIMFFASFLLLTLFFTIAGITSSWLRKKFNEYKRNRIHED